MIHPLEFHPPDFSSLMCLIAFQVLELPLEESDLGLDVREGLLMLSDAMDTGWFASLRTTDVAKTFVVNHVLGMGVLEWLHGDTLPGVRFLVGGRSGPMSRAAKAVAVGTHGIKAGLNRGDRRAGDSVRIHGE